MFVGWKNISLEDLRNCVLAGSSLHMGTPEIAAVEAVRAGIAGGLLILTFLHMC